MILDKIVDEIRSLHAHVNHNVQNLHPLSGFLIEYLVLNSKYTYFAYIIILQARYSIIVLIHGVLLLQFILYKQNIILYEVYLLE